jgi:2-keto-4-pentenoate hydratase
MDLDRLARQQLADYDRHTPGSIFADRTLRMTIDDAYALQLAVAGLRQRRGEAIAGYKVGCISPTMQAQLGLDRPVFGHVFASEVRRSSVALDPDQFDGLAIEGEFAVRLAQDIPDADWLRGHAAEAISTCFAVIELHNYVFRNTPHDAQELIGNNAIHAGAIVPVVEAPLRHPSELLDAEVQVSINGTTLGAESGAALPGGPLESLIQLVEHLARYERILQRGQIVLTGSPLGLYRVGDGDRIEVRSSRSLPVTASVARAQSA